jgi:hypothetical protein
VLLLGGVHLGIVILGYTTMEKIPVERWIVYLNLVFCALPMFSCFLEALIQSNNAKTKED